MWTLDSKTGIYSINKAPKKKWTWGKVSSEALKYMQSKDSNVPKFIPIVNYDSDVKDKSTRLYKYGLQLYELTRFAFDSLQLNPNENIHSVFKKMKTTKKKRLKPKLKDKKHRFGMDNTKKFDQMFNSDNYFLEDPLPPPPLQFNLSPSPPQLNFHGLQRPI